MIFLQMSSCVIIVHKLILVFNGSSILLMMYCFTLSRSNEDSLFSDCLRLYKIVDFPIITPDPWKRQKVGELFDELMEGWKNQFVVAHSVFPFNSNLTDIRLISKHGLLALGIIEANDFSLSWFALIEIFD